jgi:hypothetical protein
MTGERAAGQTFSVSVSGGRHTVMPSSEMHVPEPPAGEGVGDGVGDGAGSVGAGAGSVGAGAGAGDGTLAGFGVGCDDVAGCPAPGEPPDATSRGALPGRVW